jgi:hypothetical protein
VNTLACWTARGRKTGLRLCKMRISAARLAAQFPVFDQKTDDLTAYMAISPFLLTF